MAMDTGDHVSALPQFVASRIESFQRSRMGEEWGGRHLLHGASPTPDGLRLSSNDYLCLSNERSLQQAQINALHKTAAHVLMSPVFQDERSATRRLESALAHYAGVSDSILCQSGWVANTGLLQAIADERTPVYLDHLAHMSLWYGARAVGAPVFPFRHNNAESLRQKIRSTGPGIIAVDAIYSTNGSLCELADIAVVSSETQCVLVVDESHSLGVFGSGGATVTQTLKLEEHVHFITVSLAKAFAGRAGLVGCPKRFKDYFMMAAYPVCFSSALLDHELAWIEAALRKLRKVEDRRVHLHAISSRVRQALQHAEIPMSPGTQQIIALEGGSESQTMRLRDALESEGIYGSVFCAPATPRRHALIRLSLHSGVTQDQADTLVRRCVDVWHRS
ncbi:alpha-hydroxyketone-type quorum-sensing autoinducer synthase [Pseudomonas sp. KU43P]|uniref:alpha-hydroxyketone-type quorum-sensing autoinducer synthase n=1 Tax=Pseudomonas sp. KU43P TaxID=2487887 RepID=UPI002954B195|nr:alpha-hydroxyketone-type quorum-sensing autoinducer synthase [Pseudomonas sp. KU43P]